MAEEAPAKTAGRASASDPARTTLRCGGRGCRAEEARHHAEGIEHGRGHSAAGALWPQRHRSAYREPLAQACELFLGSVALDDRGCGADLAAPPGLVRFLRGGRASRLQRGGRLLAGLQGRQRARCAEEGAGPEGARAARRHVAVRRCGRARPRRRGERGGRADRARRSPADRRRVPERRSVGAHRRVAAGLQEGRRRRLFRRHRQAGRP